MPEKKTIERAHRDKAQGKSPSTQAGEFVREEMDHIREGKHGARSTRQAIAIGLSKARRAGVALPPQPGQKAEKATTRPPNPKRSRATTKALRREGSEAASPRSLARQARTSAQRRGPAARKKAARQAARTRASHKA